MKKIRFGNNDSYAILIDNCAFKEHILNQLYNDVLINNNLILMKRSNLVNLQTVKHYIRLDYDGINYYLYFMNYNNNNLVLLIESTYLQTNKNDNNIGKIIIVQIETTTGIKDKYFTKKTVYYGKLVQHKQNYLFLVYDYFYYLGNTSINENLSVRIDNINNTQYNFINFTCANFKFSIAKYYDYSQLKTIIAPLLHNSMIKINGLLFMPGRQTEPTYYFPIEQLDPNNIFSIINYIKNYNYDYYANQTEIKKIKRGDEIDVFYCDGKLVNIKNMKISEILNSSSELETECIGYYDDNGIFCVIACK